MSFTPGVEIDPYAEVRQLRSAAATSAARANEARALALEIDRRRITILERDDDCVARHTAEVWSSRAAERSRTILTRSVGYALWMVSTGLQEAMRDLENAATAHDEDARWFRRRADEREDELATAVLGGTVS